MASKTVTPKSESNEQDNKSKSSQEMSNKPETIPLKSPSVIEEIINDKNSPIIERHLTEEFNETSPDIYAKQTYAPLAAASISARTSPRLSKARVAHIPAVVYARPFDEFLTTDTSTTDTNNPDSKDGKP